jgi:hypothetical protein
MSPTKTLIAEAVSRFPLQDTPAWKELMATYATAELDRIDTDPSSITTVDCLFDGQATVVLKNAGAVPVMVFGRFDGRRAEVERVVLAA